MRLRLLPLALILAGGALPADAQQSDGYKFLQAVRDAKAEDVTRMVESPGSRIVDTRDVTTGEGALHIVIKRADHAYLVYLLQHGADPNLRDGHGDTPLLLAVQYGQIGLMKDLLDSRASPNLGNTSGETPLIRAVQRRDLAMTRELLTAGANPDQPDIVAGLSARDYARRDTRSPALAKLLDETPKRPRAAAAGPRL